MKYCRLCGGVRLDDDIQQIPDKDENGDFDLSKLVGCILANKYRIEERLATGSMGVVFRARHNFIDNDLAVKILHPNLASDHIMLERFVREARTLALIDHPNTIKVIDFGHIENFYYMVMEYIKGISLRTYLERQKHLSVTETVKIISQVCAAVDAAHKNQIIHRDLKPENIMLKQDRDKELMVKVVDFGIAKENKSGRETKNLTAVGTIVGTPHYMSPEQGMSANVDIRSDIYSLGVITFEALTGQRVFEAPLAVSVIVRKITEVPPKIQSIRPEISEEVDDVVMRALDKDPANRFASANDFAVELALAAFKNTSPTYQVTTAKIGLPKAQLTSMIKRETAFLEKHTGELGFSRMELNGDSLLDEPESGEDLYLPQMDFQSISSSLKDQMLETSKLEKARDEKVEIAPTSTNKRQKLLVVINSPTIILVISRHMQKLGYDVQAITNSKAAIPVVSTEKLSAIIIGLDLPELSGEDLCKLIKTDPELKTASNIPVLLFSSLEEEELEKKVKKSQADGFIHKAWKMDRVAEVIKNAISQAEKALTN